jgi:hypothetical protein
MKSIGPIFEELPVDKQRDTNALCEKLDDRVNPLGNYNEGAIIFPVLTPGENKPCPFFGTLKRLASNSLGSYVYRMPVDQEFTTHGGRFIWGFPK